MQREHDLLLREHPRMAVSGHGAHISMSDALQGFPPERAGARVAGIHHSARDLVYHVDVVLHDLIDRAVADEYHPHEYPSGYRPQDHAPPSTEAWHVKLQALEDALATIRSWVDDETRDLLAPLDRGDGHTLFSADHARCGSHVVPLCANG